MADPPTRLENLPVEAIICIAQNLSCDEVIRLSMVSRRLFVSCRDWTVFQQNIRWNHKQRNMESDWDLTFLTPGTPQDLGARYALADQRICEFLLDDEFIAKSSKTPVAFYVPQLILNHHPMITPQALPKLCDLLLAPDNVPVSHELLFTFIVTACVLGNIEHKKMLATAHFKCYNLVTKHKATKRNKRANWLCRSLYKAYPIPWARRHNRSPAVNDPFPDGNYLNAYEALTFFYSELKMALLYDDLAPPRSADPEDLDAKFPEPPTLRYIPFRALMPSVLPPFSPHTPALITACHIPAMASEAFLTTGTWTGYACFYSTRHWNNINFQHPMSKIQFRKNAGKSVTKVSFSAKGKMVGDVGAFGFSGVMDTKTGKIAIVANYEDDGKTVHWQALMTPFGIVASSGTDIHADWMWLWKEEWTAGAA